MSIKKNNTYFKEDDGKIYYYDDTGVKKDVPSTAFSDLQEQIDGIGKPLTYSGSKSVTEINELETIKVGTVYTITGEAGTVTAGNVEAKQGDEIAWGGDPAQWFNIGKDKVDSWKTWSEEHGSTGVDGSVYIGKNNSADYIGINIGAENQILNGDDTLGASINIGKNNVNRYGILIGQRNESQGYGYSLGDDNTNIFYGDLVLGYNNTPNYTQASRIIIGINNNGNINTSTTLIGRNISGDYTNSDTTIIGSNFAAYAEYGSIIIAQNGNNSDIDLNNNRKSLTARSDANIFGGYVTANNQAEYYKNPGISAVYNSMIIGQGQNISAESDAYVFGNQSIAKYGSKVLGSHGYAEGDSMVINWPNINYGVPISSNKTNTVDETLNTGYFYKVTNGTHRIISNISGDIYENKHPNYRLVQSGSNHALMVLNVQWCNGGKGVYGKWDEEGKTFTEGAGSQWAYKLTANINSDAIVVEYYNGNVTVSSYSQAGTAFPKYYNLNNWINEPTGHSMVTDGRYIYHSNSGIELNLNNEPTIPSFFIDPDFINEETKNNLLYDARTNQLGYTISTTGNTYKFVHETINVLPSAVLSQKEMVTISQAYYGSLAVGPRNSAFGGSIAINVVDKYSNANTGSGDNYTYNLIHNYSLYEGNLNQNLDYRNSAAYGSIAIGLGSYSYYSNIPTIYPNTGNYAYCGSFVLGTNNSASYGSIVIGGNASAEHDSVSIGMKGGRNNVKYRSIVVGEENTASAHSYIVGFKSRAEGLAYTFGYQNSAYSNGFTFGYNSYASGNGVAVGQQVTAYGQSFGAGWNITADNKSVSLGHNQHATSNSIALGMKGGTNFAEQLSLAVGFQNTASKNSYAIGFNNSAKEFAWTYGFNNYIWGMGMFLGFGNHDWYGSGGYSNSGDLENVDMFGRWNEVVGYIPISESTSQTGKSYETTIIGNNNKLIITGTDFLNTATNYGYEFAGIFLGKQNECYMASAGGYNIYLGFGNKGAYEAINIGTDNDTMGHSIGLGWHNRAVKGGYAHTILIGNSNNSKNTQGYIYQKSYPYINQKILSNEEIGQIQGEIDELVEQRTTAYQNASNKANEIYSLLTANGLDSVSAENYINGTLYNSGYGHSYISPYTPWGIQNYPNGISYKENGTWYTGYGESAYVKRWIYSTSSYSSYDTSDYYYKYYWLPAKQASSTWSIVSSIYTAHYGPDSANRYNAVNIAIQHIDELTQAIYTKQDELSQNPITASGTTDSHNIETMSLVVGQGNSADHHNSIILGSENHSLKMVNDNLTGDDGFTVAIGIGNTVARNYDMAIGYGSVAFGGENIAIGQYIYDSNNEIYRYTSAVGLRNISLRSTVTGFNNVAVDSHLLGTGVTSTIDTDITSNYGSWNTNFEKNKLFDSIPTILGGSYSIRNNNFDDIKNTIFTINYCFDRNDLRNIKKTYITAGTATDNILHNVYDTVIIDNYNNEFNTYTNVISSTLQTNSYNSFNTYKNVTSADISAGYNNGSNIFYDIGGWGTRFNNQLKLTADYLCHNIVINATITGSSLEWPGISNNFIWKSYVQPYKATAYGQGQISTYGDSFSENMLIGTEAFNTVHESFSFGALAGDLIPHNTEGQNSIETPILRDCTRVWNFGDNAICHAYDTFVAGLGNELNGVNKFHVLGTNNYVKLKNIDSNYDSSNGSNGFHDSIILGNVNAISTPINDYDGYRNTRNYIIGQANTIIATSSTLYNNENSDLKIIGNDNHYAGTNSFIAGLLGNDSIYKWVTDIYENSYGNTSSYNSIIPVYYDDYVYDGKQLVSSLSSYPISGASRDMMIGSRNVISNNITDSTIIGFYNAIHQDEQEHEIKFNNSNIIGSYNLAINGSNQFNVGFNNITSGHHSTAIGEELKANAFQTILGKYNISALGTSRTTMKWNSATSAVEHLDNTGVLLAVGNGRLNLYEKWSKNAKNSYSSYNWFDESGNLIPRKNISDEQYIQRSNAMIVSADGTVSSTKLATVGVTDVGAAITALQSQMGNIETALNTIINGSNS